MIFRKYSESIYRYDIQGVRALGAILIMIYHIWFGKVSGGVDIFFVVSGYFMAAMLMKSYLKNSIIKPFEFWSRIIRKVFPLAYTVIIITTILGYFFMPPNLWMGSINQALTSALNIENLYLMYAGTDYLSRYNPPSPFQQFWALSIQIQFYAILPFIFMMGLYLSNKFNSYKPLLIIIFTIIIISLCFSIYYTNINPAAAYFNTLTRAWEFFIGVAIFLILPLINISKEKSKIILLVGFLLIFCVGIFVPNYINYPGYIALLPVIAASCIIVAGNYNVKGYIYKFLSSKPLVYIGGLSFSLYLWHWPILVYFQHYKGNKPGEINIIEGFLIVVFSLIASLISKNLIEKYFINLKKSSVVFSYIVGLIFFIPVFLFCLYIRSSISLIYDEFEKNKYNVGKNHNGNNAYVQNHSVSKKQLITINKDYSILFKNCLNGVVDGEISYCELGDKKSDVSILLVGGSRLAHWEPLFSYLGEEKKIKIIAATMRSCSFGYNVLQEKNCQDWNNKIINFITNINPKPKIIVVNTSRSEHKDTIRKMGLERGEYMPLGYIENIKKIHTLGIPIVGIRINPVFDDPNTCLWRSRFDSDSQCKIKYSDSLLESNPALKLKEMGLTNFYPVDFTNVMCSDGLCPLVFNGYLTMMDDSHFSASYISYLAPVLVKSLDEQVGGITKILEK